MSCEQNKVCCEKFEMAKADMVLGGFDPSQIADLIAQYGNDVITLVVEALKNGFSKEFVLDVLSKFGPVVLQFLMSWLQNMQQNAAKSVAGDQSPTTSIDAGLIQTFLESMLPKLLDKYGEQILDALISMIVKYLTNS